MRASRNVTPSPFGGLARSRLPREFPNFTSTFSASFTLFLELHLANASKSSPSAGYFNLAASFVDFSFSLLGHTTTSGPATINSTRIHLLSTHAAVTLTARTRKSNFTVFARLTNTKMSQSPNSNSTAYGRGTGSSNYSLSSSPPADNDGWGCDQAANRVSSTSHPFPHLSTSHH